MMKLFSAVSLGIGLVLLASPALAQPTVIGLGTVSQFTGPGDLDLDGNIVKATNFNGPDTVVNGVTFATDVGDPDYIGPQNVVGWQTKPEYGDTADDDSLEAIMHNIRWANTGAPEQEFLEAHIPVVAGQEYQLQILVSGNHEEARVWDLEVEGIEAVDGLTSLGLDTDTYDIGRSVVYTVQAEAPDDVFDIRMGTLFGQEFGADLNPIWQGLTLEAIPEPTTASLLLLGLVSIGVMRKRRK